MTIDDPLLDPELAQLRVLIVDDEADIRLGLARLLGGLGLRTREASDGRRALELLEEETADLVLTDLMMPGMGGAELLHEVKRRAPSTAVVILTGYGTVAVAVTCMQNGAAHFLTKPFDNREVQELVARLGRQLLAARQEPDAAIVAVDPRMEQVMTLVDRVAPSPLPVLLVGESGTGKEVVARAVHERSDVADQPFLGVNCAALSDTLLESELFGHERGAFTGATRAHEGIFAQARGGTVFLDEVASMSPAFQGKLLRVLQERLVRPVGGTHDLAVDFRLISASNRVLPEMVAKGEFREDLYYRLKGVEVAIPPLRERPRDLLPLTHALLARAAARCLASGQALPELGHEAVAAIERHAWPGNVRELQNAIERALIVCAGDRILPYHLGLTEPDGTGRPKGAGERDYASAKQDAVESFQRAFVQRALEKSAGNVSRAAATAGMTRAAFQKIMRQLGIERERFERA